MKRSILTYYNFPGPYSNFRVGAAFLCDDGTWVAGGNVENASYPVTICGERTALVKAVVCIYASILRIHFVACMQLMVSRTGTAG